MKKIIIASIMAISAVSAFAGSATVEYKNTDTVNGGPGATALALTVQENVGYGIVADFGITNTQTSVSRALGTQVELGGTYGQKVGPVMLSSRVAVGKGYTNGDSASYWSVEPAVSYAVNDKFTAKLGYRYQSQFDASVAAKTQTIRVGGAYAFTKKDTVGIRFDTIRGDAQSNVVAVNYTRSF